MYKIILNQLKPKNVYVELINVFLKVDEYLCITEDEKISDDLIEFEDTLIFSGEDYDYDRNLVKQAIYKSLQKLTGKTPQWGIMTGIRPVKVAGELIRKTGSNEKAKEILTDFYFLSNKKASEIIEIYVRQNNLSDDSMNNLAGIYIGIPFCPSRCLYCSFTSNKGEESEIEEYLQALYKEIMWVGREMKKNNLFSESLYIGGGTPTTLSAEQLDKLLKTVYEYFDLSKCREITVEAGRPDTITTEKLKIISKHKVNRISINPQTMKDETLKTIGRNHCKREFLDSFDFARAEGFEIINTDLIAGLPGEDKDDFVNSLNQVIELGAENITIHTLAVKKTSRLFQIDSQFHHKQEKTVIEMLNAAEKILIENGYMPYYLYRQKNMAAGLENVGYSKINKESIYNIRIMDEHQSIIALGAGGITKVYFPDEDRLERVPNVSNYQIYIQRIDEMIKRKKDNLF